MLKYTFAYIGWSTRSGYYHLICAMCSIYVRINDCWYHDVPILRAVSPDFAEMIDEGIYTQSAYTHCSLSHNFTVVMIRSGFASAPFSHHVNVIPSLFVSISSQTPLQLYTHKFNVTSLYIHQYKPLAKSLCLQCI